MAAPKAICPAATPSSAHELSALNLVAEHGPLTLRLGRADGKMTINTSASLNGLLAGLRAAGTGYHFPQLNQLADDLELNKKKASFTSAGLGLDWNNIVVQTEYAKRKTDSYVNDTSAWYVMAGYRFGKVLPFYIHSELKIDGVPPTPSRQPARPATRRPAPRPWPPCAPASTA
jgi:hypothetical protein